MTDIAAIDPVPCPDCGELTHPCETTCAACGTHLSLKNNERPGSQSLGGDSANRAEEVIVVAPTGCTCGGNSICQACVLAEYDNDPFAQALAQALDIVTAPDNVRRLPAQPVVERQARRNF